MIYTTIFWKKMLIISKKKIMMENLKMNKSQKIYFLLIKFEN